MLSGRSLAVRLMEVREILMLTLGVGTGGNLRTCMYLICNEI